MVNDEQVSANIRKRVLQGDREAFSDIVRMYQDYVYSSALGLLGNEDVANEIAQDAFIRAYKYLRSFKGLSSFKTWLTRIVINCVKDYYNSKRYKQTLDAETFNTAEHEIVLNEQVNDGDKELQQKIREEITKLSEKAREVLVMKFIDGLSYQEIANELKIPVGTVSSRMNKALMELRVRIKDFIEME